MAVLGSLLAMIAGPESTSETMSKALATSIGALVAGEKIDVDRTDDDRLFFATERATLQGLFDTLAAAAAAVKAHVLLVAMGAQAMVAVGDVVLDRGVSRGKARMKVELKESAMPLGADHVFGVDVSELTGAELAREPTLVLQAVAKFPQVPDFPGKDVMAKDLGDRADQQQDALATRDKVGVTGAGLDGAEKVAVVAGADALYGLEKRLLDRFKRQTTYVKAFFLDVAPPKPSKKTEEAPPAAAAPAAAPAGSPT